MKTNIAQKCLTLMKLQAACFGINLDQENLIYSPKRLDNPEFVDLLLGEDKGYKNLGDTESSGIQFMNMDFYQTPIPSMQSYALKDDKVKQVSGVKNTQSPRDYLMQKLMAIQALKDQIDFKDETKISFNKN